MQQEIRYLFNEILVLNWVWIGFGLALFGFVPFWVFGDKAL